MLGCSADFKDGRGNLFFLFFRYVFFFDLHNLKKCWKTCVKVCPDRNLENMADLRDFETRTGSQLCRYDQYFPEHAADKRTSQFACPNFTIFER